MVILLCSSYTSSQDIFVASPLHTIISSIQKRMQNRRRRYCAKDIHTADPVGMGRKSRQYNYIPVLTYSCTGMTFCPCRLDRLYVFGAMSSSFICVLIQLNLCVPMVHCQQKITTENLIKIQSSDGLLYILEHLYSTG